MRVEFVWAFGGELSTLVWEDGTLSSDDAYAVEFLTDALKAADGRTLGVAGLSGSEHDHIENVYSVLALAQEYGKTKILNMTGVPETDAPEDAIY